jgi:predicted transcriptional regulator of viral defense system
VETIRNTASFLNDAGTAAKRLRVFRTNKFVSKGFPREYLLRMLKAGELQRLGRGLYAVSNFDGDNNQTLLEVSQHFPKGVMCLLTALRFHDIGTQSPFEVWLALPRGLNFSKAAKGPVRFFKFSNTAYGFGVEKHKVAGGIIRVYSPAKTVADCFKYRNKFGIDVAVEALRDGWRNKKFTMAELAEAADACRVRRVMQPYMEMMA